MVKHIYHISKSMPLYGYIKLKVEETPEIPSITGLIEVFTEFFNAFMTLLRFKYEVQNPS